MTMNKHSTTVERRKELERVHWLASQRARYLIATNAPMHEVERYLSSKKAIEEYRELRALLN